MACCFLYPQVVRAANFNYNFFEVRSAVSPETLGGEVNTTINENSHFIMRADTRFDQGWDGAVGIGFNGPINQFMDVYGQMMLHFVTYPQEEEEDDIKGMYELNVGSRVWLTNQIEAHVRVGRIDESSVFIGGLRIHSTDQLSLSAEARNAGLWGPQFSMGIRLNY
uniref:Outer membrane protein beta-barrel domain-containing protein n=1 Tax=Vibrio ziniensis TaxID=2711221 RepID=A0A6G7CR54_9VIBR|nr:hypothetical protein G5S32_19645 [Vibrio ziniensis]